jgi:CRP-like cAMP-binding protein
MAYHEELIHKVKFFELADSSFLLKIVEYLKPHIYLPQDYITIQDKYATNMYFIRHGVCEVFSTDGSTRICYLVDGEYFGEIGILLKERRTVSVRAVSQMEIAAI